MRLHRFIVDADLNTETLAISDGELVSQWKNVLRYGPGDHVLLCDGRDTEAEAEIVALDKREAEVRVLSRTMPEREARKKASLFCALLKRENFELVVQKATELGISRIVPLLTERTVKIGFNRERLEKIIREAAEQSGRTILPELAEPVPLTDALTSVDSKTAVFFDLNAETLTPADYAPFTAAFIGPEGGFSESETQAARDAGLRMVSFGPLTLRGETAGIVAAYLVCQ